MMDKKTGKRKILKLIILILAAFVLLIIVLGNISIERNKTITDNTPKDSRLADPDLLYASFSDSGLCSNDKGEEGGCYTYIFLYQSGKYIYESGWQGRNDKKEISPTIEKQLDQDMIDKIIKQIKDTDIMNKNCPSILNQDAWFTYQLNLDGVKKFFKASPIYECQKKFWEIDILINSMAESANLNIR